MLTSAGYDSAISIADLNESDILLIQNHVSSKATDLLSTHEAYAQQEKFEFLPGHRKLILGLRNKVKDFINSKNKNFNKPKGQEPAREPVNEEASEEVELLTDQEIQKLKKQLVEKLNKHIKVKSNNFTENNIIGTIDAYISRSARVVSSRTASYKSNVKCSDCDKTVPCTFNKRWELSNLQAHFKAKHTKPSLTSSSGTNTDTNTNSNSSLLNDPSNDPNGFQSDLNEVLELNKN